VRVPLDIPDPNALKETVISCEPPTGIVTGNTLVSTPKPVPIIVALLTVTGVLPVLKRLTNAREVVLNSTFPKEKLEGATVTEVSGLIPFPLATSDTTGVPPTALLVKVTTPVLAPAAAGVKDIVTTCVAPAAKVSGKLGLTILKPVPVTVPVDTCVVAVPGLDIVTVCVAVDPMLTFPK